MPSDNVRRLHPLTVRPIDPRDGRWEVEPSAYRVYFWRVAGEGMFLADGSPMYASTEYEISGAGDVAEILEWANANAEGRTFTIYAVVDHVPSDRGIVQIYGVDPTRNV